MIVDPSAPHVTPPAVVTSPDGWLTAAVDGAHAGVWLRYQATHAPALPGASTVRKVRIVRQDPGASAPAPVRSADPAWAVEGAGLAYDHEAPLGAAVVYAATPQFANGTWGPTSSLSVPVPAPAAGAVRDLWIKSLDEPGLSLAVTYASRDGQTSSGRQETASRSASPFTAVAYDTASAPAETVKVDVLAADIARFRDLIRSGVLLAQVRPGYQIPDRYFVPGDVSEQPTGRLGSTGGYTVSFDIVPIERPDTADAPLAVPGWSYDTLAAQFATYDAVAASYPTYLALASNGAI
ncbi:hypothetical protein [Streptomyces sp. SPB78]|uniref:hypothetical protein n=1 Tax=Streptomyces sp. (strain SPB78) TaxID=591157 RepID=UPI0001B5697D|nr:hypothetical protein [Streptomyces sp. SPB78]